MDRVIEALKEGGVQARWQGSGSQHSLGYAVPVGARGTLLLDNAEDAARALAILAGALLAEEEDETSRTSVMKRILRGNYDENDPLSHCDELEQDAPRCVLVMQSRDDAQPLMRALNELFPQGGPDVVVETGVGRMAVVKDVRSMQEEELVDLCMAIQDTVKLEAGMRVAIGVGGIYSALGQLALSYNEALSAIRVGGRFHPERDVYVYRTLILERFLQQVPAATLRDYHAQLFGPQNERLLSDEMLHTIERFFECNLNLSMAARQLFVHRNTLVYRLDKFQKAVGLDLRRFDDAVIYKLLYMMGTGL